MPRLAIEDCGFYCYTLSGWRTGGSGFRSCPQDKRFLSENGDTPSPHRTHPCGVFPKNTQKSGAVRRFFVCVNYAIHLAQQRAATRGIRDSAMMSRKMFVNCMCCRACKFGAQAAVRLSRSALSLFCLSSHRVRRFMIYCSGNYLGLSS